MKVLKLSGALALVICLALLKLLGRTLFAAASAIAWPLVMMGGVFLAFVAILTGSFLGVAFGIVIMWLIFLKLDDWNTPACPLIICAALLVAIGGAVAGEEVRPPPYLPFESVPKPPATFQSPPGWEIPPVEKRRPWDYFPHTIAPNWRPTPQWYWSR